FIEADEQLGLIPWAALVMKDSTYFGESHTVVNTPGILFPAHHPASGGQVVVAEPGAVELEGVHYPPLPHAAKEARSIASLYPGAILHEGTEVTETALLRDLQQASILQFAGHATERAYGGELLVHSATGRGATLSASSLSQTALKVTQLVVL